MITFSIVTITYNAQKVLQPTLNSVLQQDYPHIEHLIIDGASTDDTLRIAEDYKKLSDENDNGHEIKITSEPDDGIYFAMNKALNKAQGDYIVFLNAGDSLPENDTLEHVMLAAEAGDGEDLPAVLFGNTDIIDAKGNFLYHRPLSPAEKHTCRRGKLHAGRPDHHPPQRISQRTLQNNEPALWNACNADVPSLVRD